jgi:hypothetical protein
VFGGGDDFSHPVGTFFKESVLDNGAFLNVLPFRPRELRKYTKKLAEYTSGRVKIPS